MQSMSSLLADVFNTKTAAVHTEEDLVKQADYEFFGALCRKENIDVSQLTDEKVADLFKVAMQLKAAGEGKDGHEGKETKEKEKAEEAALKEKEAAARAEYQEKRAAAVKCAEAEAMGRIMAHSFVDEMAKVSAAMGGFPFAKKEEGKEGKEEGKEKKEEGKEKKDEGGEKEASVARANAVIAAFEQAKTASVPGSTSTPNFDEIAAWHAIDLLKQAHVDEKVAFERVNAAYVLGLPESVKMASAADENKALELRALEICDAAGFQVDWSQVQ
jgi:hypothetical protein